MTPAGQFRRITRGLPTQYHLTAQKIALHELQIIGVDHAYDKLRLPAKVKNGKYGSRRRFIIQNKTTKGRSEAGPVTRIAVHAAIVKTESTNRPVIHAFIYECFGRVAGIRKPAHGRVQRKTLHVEAIV